MNGIEQNGANNESKGYCRILLHISEREIAIVGVGKKAAMANAKLKVFEKVLLEELGKDFE